MPRTARSGFTVIELAVVVAIVAALTALAYDGMRRSRPRATFDGVSAELQSLVHAARQQALASGVNVAVLVFPDHVQGQSTGRIIVVQDAPTTAASLFNETAPLNFDNYDPAKLAAPTNGQVVTTLDLPANVLVGPATGLGHTLPYPYAGIATTRSCSFCTGKNHRGAIRFNSRGRADFLESATTPSPGNTGGGSLSIYSTDLGVGSTYSTTTLVITSPFGSLRSFHNG